MKDKFLRGAVILTAAGLIVKIFGSVNRIILSRLLGGEGIGLYQMAYPFYLLMLSISSAGVPVAVSIVVAEKLAQDDYGGARQVFKVTLRLMVVFGLLFALSLYLLAGVMVDYGFIRDSRAYLALVVLTPAVFFSSILASFRGYFQGFQMMTPPAVSQIVEQFVRVTAMVVLAYWLLPYGLEYAAAGAAFGALPGGLAGLLVLSWFYRRVHRQQTAVRKNRLSAAEDWRHLAKRLILLAIPVSCANLLVPVTSSIDMIMVPNCLGRAGFGITAATTMFGYLSGMAQPLLMMSLIPTISIAASLVPAVTSAYAVRDQKAVENDTQTALKLCLLLTLPAAAGMAALSQPLAQVLYGAAQAAPVIANLAPSIVFLGIFQVTTGALQGLGLTAVPMWNMLGGAVIRVLALWYLTSQAAWNILGAAWSSNLNYLAVALVNGWYLYRRGLTFPWLCGFKSLGASLIMGLLAEVIFQMLSSGIGKVAALLAAVAAGAAVYVILVLVTGVLTPAEMAKLPLIGKKISRKE